MSIGQFTLWLQSKTTDCDDLGTTILVKRSYLFSQSLARFLSGQSGSNGVKGRTCETYFGTATINVSINSLSSTRSSFFTTSSSDLCDRLPLYCQPHSDQTQADLRSFTLEIRQVTLDKVIRLRLLLLYRIDRVHLLSLVSLFLSEYDEVTHLSESFYDFSNLSSISPSSPIPLPLH